MSYKGDTNTLLRDLNVKLQGSWVQECIDIVLGEIKAKGLNFKPHFWISDEFFSPDGVPGVAIPFYLFHPELIKLEKDMVGVAEGENKEWLLKILRHEVGHAIDNAFHLRKLKKRQQIFGLSKTEYPDSYIPKVYSKSYVIHLEDNYAQAHPDEDWAETFAVWLDPKSNWKKKYKNWPALKKLEYIDCVMKDLLGLAPKVKSKLVIDGLRDYSITLKEHYKLKRKRPVKDSVNFFRPCMDRFFSKDKRYTKKAGVFLKEKKSKIRGELANKCNTHKYHLEKILNQIIKDCEEKDYRLKSSLDLNNSPFLNILAKKSKNYLTKGNHRIIM